MSAPRLIVRACPGLIDKVVFFSCFAVGLVIVAALFAIVVDVEGARPSVLLLFSAMQLIAWCVTPELGWFASVVSIVCVAGAFLPVRTEREFVCLGFFVVSVAATNLMGVKRWSLERSVRRDQQHRAANLRNAKGFGGPASERFDAPCSDAGVRACQPAGSEVCVGVSGFGDMELSASVLHEIHQPITALIAQGAAARRWLNRDPPDICEVRHSVDGMVRCGERAIEVMRELRTLFESGPGAFELVNLNEVVQRALGCSAQAKTFGQDKIICDLEPHPPEVWGDRIQLELAVLNLISNAVEAMQEAASASDRLEVRSCITEGCVCISVMDTGPGFRNDGATFRQFHSSKVGGLGMGLSICRRVIEVHHGAIAFSNCAGGGAIVEIRLPVGKAV